VEGRKPVRRVEEKKDGGKGRGEIRKKGIEKKEK
jgi:hypothetical protein